LIGRVPIGVRKILAPECGARTGLARVFYKPKSRNVKNFRAPQRTRRKMMKFKKSYAERMKF